MQRIERVVVASGGLAVKSHDHGIPSRRLVFLCTGNTCRSPYAEALASRYGLEAVSCGTHTTANEPPDPMAIVEASRRGVDLSTHRTTRWQDLELFSTDIVIPIELVHALRAFHRARAVRCSVVLLSSLLPRPHPAIWDPYGRDKEAYRLIFDRIDTAAGRLVGLLRHEAA